MRLERELLTSTFSHIYIEKEALKYSLTKEILERFKNSIKIEIDDYKEVFSRNNQNFELQKKSPKLILAVKKDRYLYEGAIVCESFGNENFYYISSVINCIYDCEYCYLQGVYSSGNIVIFVNIDDMFEEVKKELEKRSMYICISYDTDLLALEGMTSLVKKWYKFTKENTNLKIELRTKSANIKIFDKLEPNPNFIIAWTLSPKEFVEKYELRTATLEQRIVAAKTLIEKGWSVRICFDPIINIKDFEYKYGKLVDMTFKEIESSKILDVSMGTFRISKEYLKRMRKNREGSLILNYPFTCNSGVYSYSEDKNKEMLDYMKEKILKYVDIKKLFV